MQVEILYRPSYSVARVTLDRGEEIQAESGAMVGMSPNIMMETEAAGGFRRGRNAR
jgi:uncharacterized protein (AIM24 family)